MENASEASSTVAGAKDDGLTLAPEVEEKGAVTLLEGDLEKTYYVSTKTNIVCEQCIDIYIEDVCVGFVGFVGWDSSVSVTFLLNTYPARFSFVTLRIRHYRRHYSWETRLIKSILTYFNPSI